MQLFFGCLALAIVNDVKQIRVLGAKQTILIFATHLKINGPVAHPDSLSGE
jgi:hypothetical protein